MFDFLKRFLPTSLGGNVTQEPINKRKREDMAADQHDEFANNNNNNTKKTKPNIPEMPITTTISENKLPNTTQQVKDSKKEESSELAIFLKKQQETENQIIPIRSHKKKNVKKAKSKLISEKPILTDEVIVLDDDEDDLKHAYKKLDGNLVNEKYIQNHSEAIHTKLNTQQKVNSEIKVPHIPVGGMDTEKKNEKKVESVPIRVQPKPPIIISRKLFNNKDKGPTLFRGDQVDRLTSKLDSILSLKEKSEETRITRSFIEKEAINRASSKIISILCKELLGEEAKKLHADSLPQAVYNKLVSEIITETVAKEKETFPLSERDRNFVAQIFRDAHKKPQEVLVLKFNIDITRAKIQCLNGLEWLNDEVINFYLNMVKERSEKNPDKYPKIHVFNTFFYAKLTGEHNNTYNYSAVRRWTKKIDLLEYDKIIIPIHLSVHWTLAIINLRDSKFEFFDSMNGHRTGMKVLQNLEKYLVDEIKDKKGVTYETSSWEKSMPPVPQQANGSDCGVFTCKFANYAAQDLPFSFSQKHMRYFRDRMVLEIVRAKELL